MHQSGLNFKNLNVLSEMLTHGWYLQLIGLFKWIIVRHNWSKIIVTSAFREGDKGVHGTIPLRGIDIRSFVFKDPQTVCNDINECWVYDRDRPDKQVAIYHDSGRGKHIHLQVHPKTIFLGKGEIK